MPIRRVQLGYIYRSSHHDRLHHDINDSNGKAVAGGEDDNNGNGSGGLRIRPDIEEEDGVGVGQYKREGN